MSIALQSVFNAENSLLGAFQITVHGSATASNGVTDLRNAFRPTELPIDVGNIDSFNVVLPGSQPFVVPIYEWTNLRYASPGATLGENAGTGIRVLSSDTDNPRSILVGRTRGNQVLIQNIDYTYSGSFVARIDVAHYTGGLLDHRIDSIGTIYRVVLTANDANAAANLPTPGNSVPFNGRSATDTQIGGVWWRQAGRYNIAATDFVLGTYRYDPLAARFTQPSSWYHVSASDANAVSFGATWTGPWEHPYVYADHRYMRVRNADGSFSVWALSPETSPVGRSWQLLSETYIDGSSFYNKAYATALNFPLYPSDWRFLKMSFDWDSLSSTINGQTVYSTTSGLLAMPDVRIHAMQTRDLATALRNDYQLRLDIGQGRMYIARASNALAGGRSDRLLMNVFFETDSTSVWDPPAKVLRVGSRHNGSSGVRGTLRAWVY